MSLPITIRERLRALPFLCADDALALSPRFLLHLLVTLTLLCAEAASAQDTRSTVRLDGRSLFRVSATEDLAAEERAARVETRLASLLDTESTLPPAVAEPSSEGWMVTVAGVPVATVTEADAQDSLTSPAVLARQWSAAVDRELARAREQRLGWGGRFIAETRGAVQTAFARIGESAVRTLPRVFAAILVVGFFVGLAGLVLRILRGVFRRTINDLTFENLVKQLAYYSIILLGVIVAAGALGVTPQGLVAGLGLTGLVLGFALKDILSNFVSGLLILMLRPFQIGDQIVVGETEGAVERIELRATQIRTYDGRVALVPNAEVFTSRIVNNTADPVRRGTAAIVLGYDTDFRALFPAIRDVVQRTEGVLERPVTMRIEDLGTGGMLMVVGFWTDSRRSDFKDTASSVRLAIVSTLRSQGVALPQAEEWRRPPDSSPTGGRG